MVIYLSAKVLWILLLILVCAFFVFGAIFVYHWNHYGINQKERRLARIIYFLVSALILIGVMFFIGIYTIGYGI